MYIYILYKYVIYIFSYIYNILFSVKYQKFNFLRINSTYMLNKHQTFAIYIFMYIFFLSFFLSFSYVLIKPLPPINPIYLLFIKKKICIL